ncbi:Coilin [Zea mays]|uniref:Coilin n=1 Tax=Zea mays TaxID=4577 RepID=A0A3L6G677_MAIZE|nr:Coilin [Zea mays]
MARPPPAAPAPVRLRLIFENSRLLRRVQRDEGLRRCWLLLSPELATVANLAAHVAARFRLRRTCPRGVVLSMDGFTLPPFESTCIFRDNDIIRVKQKSCTKHIEHNDVHCIQDHEIIEKRSLPVDGKILAIQDKKDVCKHQEEAHDDHQLEENATASHSTENNGTSLKRKRNDGVADIPESSKGQRLKVTNSGKHIDYSKKEQNGSKKLKLSVIDIEAKKTTSQHETTTTLVEQQKSEGYYLKAYASYCF